MLTAEGGVEALRRASSLPVDLVLLSASAPSTQLGLPSLERVSLEALMLP